MDRFMRPIFRLLLLVSLLFGVSPTVPAHAAGIRYVAATGVDSADCSNSGSPCLTISYAYSQSSSGDTINIAAGTYTTAASVDITHDISINGAGAANTIVQAAVSAGIADHRLFKINNVAVTIGDLTIRYGVEASGGAINLAGGSLILNNVVVSDNRVLDTGTAGLNGGAISVNSGSLTINNSTVSGNSVTTSDTLASRGNGGGIFIGAGSVTLNNSTVSGNSARRGGGGLYTSGGTIDVRYSTIAGNTSDSDDDAVGDGGGINRSGGVINLMSSIVAGNQKGVSSPSASDCAGTITSQGYNVTGSGSGCSLAATGDLTVPPANVFTSLLGQLGDNGGTTPNFALVDASAALEQIPLGTNGCGTTFLTDQRGSVRPGTRNSQTNKKCEIGSWEAQAADPTAVFLRRLTVRSAFWMWAERIAAWFSR